MISHTFNISFRSMVLASLLGSSCGQVLAGDSLVTDKSNKLKYTPTENGDQIPDFSYCGYQGGGVSLPDIRTRVTLSPRKSGDDTLRIQEALDKVGKKSLDRKNMRGAVLLKAGIYRVSKTLRITHSGVVLRGEGQQEGGTIIIATGTKKRTLIDVRGEKSGGREIKGSRRAINQERVAVGARTLTLESTRGLSRGDTIVVFRPGTADWIRALGTDRLNRGADDDVKNWQPKEYSFGSERTIVSLRGKEITIDAPIVFAIERKFGGGYVYKCGEDLRIRNVGVERLRLVSEYKRGKHESDESHGWDGIKISNTTDSWVRNVTAVHFGYSCVNILRTGKQITVQDCACIDPVSKISGGRRYSFALDGQLCLVQRCYTRRGRHDYVMHARARGPNVFLDCVAAKPYSDSGPHHRWAVGTLYDNISCGRLNVQWRGRSGTGHGWAGANMVFWNCRASSIDCQKPPTANNYCIGCTGKIQGSGHTESPGSPVTPRSLYLRQLEARLGASAVDHVTTPEQRQGKMDQALKQRLEPKKDTLY
jgi:hypothetical protein